MLRDARRTQAEFLHTEVDARAGVCLHVAPVGGHGIGAIRLAEADQRLDGKVPRKLAADPRHPFATLLRECRVVQQPFDTRNHASDISLGHGDAHWLRCHAVGEHIALRDRLGLLTRSVEEEIAADREEQGRVLDMCRRRGLLPEEGEAMPDGSEVGEQQIVEALYALLASAPSVMQGVALVDAVGERRVQNQPGTDQEYPNWRVPMTDQGGAPVLLEALLAHPALMDRIVEAVR